MAELILTEEEERQVQEGEAASLLLESPAFLLAIERVRAQCAEGILTSAPEQVAERERLYNLSRGLSAVTEELLALQAGGIAVAENAALQSNQVDEDVQAEEPDDPHDH
jgi:hypothetical protein